MLQAFPTGSYESETTLRPASSPLWAKMFVASLRDAGSSLLGGSSKRHMEECRSNFAVCDATYHGKESKEPPEDDFLGNRPSVCSHVDKQPAPAPDRHVFNVSICKSPARLHLSVDHLVGFVDSAANRQWESGPDFIEAEIVGPELRLEVLRSSNNGSLYEADIGAAIPGEYTFDITVAYTPLTEAETAGKEAKDWPFIFVRNLVLVGNETWTPSEVALPELEKDKALTRALADGRWVRKGTAGYPHARSEMYTPEARNGTYVGYRCSHVGEYAWTPRAQQESPSWERFKTTEQIYDCLRKAKPASSKNNFTRLVMYGDSHSRTTLYVVRMIDGWTD